MNLPNSLTLSRCLLAPFFALLFSLMRNGSLPFAIRASLAVACLLSCAWMELTDLLDGRIARKRGIVTDLGKLFDPFSDALMHLTFFSLFANFSLISFGAYYAILIREFAMTFLRMLLLKAGNVLPANIFGKAKTVFYALLSALVIAFCILSVFLPPPPEFERMAVAVFHALSWIAAGFSLLSFCVYFFGGVVRGKALSSLSK